MKKINLLLLVTLVLCTTHCVAQDRYERVIQYVKNDSTLSKGLYLEEAKNDLSKLEEGMFDYLVHSQVVNEVLKEDAGYCLVDLGASASVLDYYKSASNYIDSSLTKYSSSETANVHMFFTDSTNDYLGVSVFYFEGENISEKLKEYPYIWYTNHGIFYLFKFSNGTDTIEKACKVNLLYD